MRVAVFVDAGYLYAAGSDAQFGQTLPRSNLLIETALRSHLQGDASAAPGNYAEEQTCDEVGEEHGFV